MSCIKYILKRVANDSRPTISIEIGLKISTTYSDIKLDVRLQSGRKLPIRSMIIDDDENGIIHFEFNEGEIVEGIHTADLMFYDISNPTEYFTLPEDEPIQIIARARA